MLPEGLGVGLVQGTQRPGSDFGMAEGRMGVKRRH